MLFNSISFLFFFPAVTFLYFIFPQKERWIILLVASCIFYMTFVPGYIFILFFLIILDYNAAIFIEKSQGKKRKIYLILSLIANVSILVFFKYFNLLSDLTIGRPILNILLPLGLSFHTFQSMSYTIEVYRKKYKAEKHLGIYALYVLFYPQLVAGPIERPGSLIPQFKKEHDLNFERIFDGLKLMLWGFFKKLVIADRIAVLINPIYADPNSYGSTTLVVATYLFAIQILCDFSGYCDIAIGAAKVMGINLRDNFNYPYLATSVTEFWRKWHMSLSTWFRDYVYIPLGGNRVRKNRWLINIMIVFLISGIWHGADVKFFVWGALHGLFVILETFTINIRSKLHPFISTLLTFNLISFAWIFFRAESVSDGVLIIKKIFTGIGDNYFIHNSNTPAIVILILIMGFIVILQRERDFRKFLNHVPITYRWMVIYLIIFLIIFFGEFSATEFIYFQF